MTPLLPALLSLFLAAPQAAPQAAPAQPPPITRTQELRGGYGKPRSNNDLLFYRLDVKVDPDKKTIAGKNTIGMRMLSEDSKIQIDLYDNLNVDKIMMGATPLKFTREEGAVFIEFPAPIKPGREFSIDFYYSGTPKTIGRFGGFTFSKDPAGRPWIFTACEGEGSSIWWPSKDQWRDEPEWMDLSVTIPSGLTDVSNGRFINKKDVGGGWTQWNYHVNYPINSYDVSLNIGTYEHFADKLGDLTMDFYALPEDLDKAKVQFAQAKPMMQAFEHYFGEYPFVRDGYKLIQVPYTGMEHQSAVTYGNGFKNSYGKGDYTGVGISPKFDFIIIHESAHEWFGNAVSASDQSDMWIQEGWANYLESMYVEQIFGNEDGLKYANSYKTKVQNKTPIITIPGRRLEPPQDMYFKGGLMLHTMRGVMNDDAKWWALVKETYNTFKYRNISTNDVAALFTKRFGRDMTPILNEYLRHAALPTLELTFDPAAKKVGYRWVADEAKFAMPIRVGSKAAWQTITPTTSWQTMDSTLAKDAFDVDTDHFYVLVKKLDDPIPATPAPGAAAATTPAPGGRPVLPEQTKYNDAIKIKDDGERLAAFRKIQADYPKSDFLRQVNSSVLTLVMAMPAKTAEVGPAFDQYVTDLKGVATYTADTRLILMNSQLARAVDQKVTIPGGEAALTAAIAAVDKSASASTWGSGMETLGRLHYAAGNSTLAEKELSDALAVDPSLKTAPVVLAKIAEARGNDKAALASYLRAAAAGGLKGDDETAFHALYKKINGSEKNLNGDVNAVWKKNFPNPIDAAMWKPSSLRSDRVALAELFTGSGCPPCVAADYALDAVLERYSPKDVATLVYHVHIPQPDPMTTAASTERKNYYAVAGVPTFNVDGALALLGGGPRDNSGSAYGSYVSQIDAALNRPAEAALAIKAKEDHGKVTVSTSIANIASGYKDLTLQVVLAERELNFGGENGMRFHPLVVRAMAGGDKPGLRVTIGANGRVTIDATFDLSAIGPDITKSLDAEIKKRRSTQPAGATPAVYKAEGHEMTTVDAKELVVVVFLQDADKHVLQAAQRPLK